MKKFLITILSIVYLATSSGATLHMHYCMGKMYAMDMVKSDGCHKCGMKATEGCCKDETKVVKAQDNHQSSSGQVSLFSSFAIVNRNYPVIESAAQKVLSSSATKNNSPPALSGLSRCILHSVFRL